MEQLNWNNLNYNSISQLRFACQQLQVHPHGGQKKDYINALNAYKNANRMQNQANPYPTYNESFIAPSLLDSPPRNNQYSSGSTRRQNNFVQEQRTPVQNEFIPPQNPYKTNRSQYEFIQPQNEFVQTPYMNAQPQNEFVQTPYMNTQPQNEFIQPPSEFVQTPYMNVQSQNEFVQNPYRSTRNQNEFVQAPNEFNKEPRRSHKKTPSSAKYRDYRSIESEKKNKASRPNIRNPPNSTKPYRRISNYSSEQSSCSDSNAYSYYSGQSSSENRSPLLPSKSAIHKSSKKKNTNQASSSKKIKSILISITLILLIILVIGLL